VGGQRVDVGGRAADAVEGYVAMWLGIVFSLVIGCGLMVLMFYSSRRGYDERARGIGE
jgi:hypothetical protein